MILDFKKIFSNMKFNPLSQCLKKNERHVLLFLILTLSLTMFIGGNRGIISPNTISKSSKLQATNADQYDLFFTTYLGGNNTDNSLSSAVDDSGNIYVAGDTLSPDLPMLNSWNSTLNSNSGDAFLAKFDPNGKLLYSTYLGGSKTDRIDSVAVDGNQNVYVAGFTNSLDFPTKNAYQPSNKAGSYNGFLAKFDSNGKLIFSTYIGGTGIDEAQAIAVNSSGYCYVTGQTGSQDFILKNPWNKTYGGNTDNFIAEYSPTGELLFSSFFGGNNYDTVKSITLDSNNNFFITGETSSTTLPVTSDAYQKTFSGTTDIYISEFNSTGFLQYSTYLGTDSENHVNSIAVDSNDSFYITGYTYSSNFPITTNAYSKALATSADAIVSEFNSSGHLTYSSYLGGNSDDFGTGIQVTNKGEIFISGYTDSSDFPVTSGSFNTSYSSNTDCFITKFKTDPSTLDYSTYFGGSSFDACVGIALDNSENIIFAGNTNSNNLLMKDNSYYPNYSGSGDVFLVKLTNLLAPSQPNTTQSSTSSQSSNTVTTSSSASVQNTELLSNPIVAGISGFAVVSLIVNILLVVKRKK